MTQELRRVADALDTCGVRVLRTRWYAEKIDAPLPCIIVDYQRPMEAFVLENGLELPEGDYFYLEIAVRPEGASDPLEALERLEALLEQVKSALRSAFAFKRVQFLQPEILNMPLGKQTSLSFISDLYIG